MDPIETYRREAERRGIRRPSHAPEVTDRLTLAEAAAEVGVSTALLRYHGRMRSLRLVAGARGRAFRWEVERAELERWRKKYRWNARRDGVVHWRHRNRGED